MGVARWPRAVQRYQVLEENSRRVLRQDEWRAGSLGSTGKTDPCPLKRNASGNWGSRGVSPLAGSRGWPRVEGLGREASLPSLAFWELFLHRKSSPGGPGGGAPPFTGGPGEARPREKGGEAAQEHPLKRLNKIFLQVQRGRRQPITLPHSRQYGDYDGKGPFYPCKTRDSRDFYGFPAFFLKNLYTLKAGRVRMMAKMQEEKRDASLQ